MGAVYLGVDLHLRARFEFTILDSELRAAGLHGNIPNRFYGLYSVGYGCGEGRCFRHPAKAVENLLDIVERLGPEAKDEWDRCQSRRFDLGCEGCDERLASRWQIEAPLLQRLAAVNADFALTIYRPFEPS